MSDRDYCYPPDFTVLRNRLGIRVARTLDAAERQFVAQRLLEAVPTGEFDLAHLKAIHRHLFQDVYDWAGELRTSANPRRPGSLGSDSVHRRRRLGVAGCGLLQQSVAELGGRGYPSSVRNRD